MYVCWVSIAELPLYDGVVTSRTIPFFCGFGFLLSQSARCPSDWKYTPVGSFGVTAACATPALTTTAAAAAATSDRLSRLPDMTHPFGRPRPNGFPKVTSLIRDGQCVL